MYLCLNLLVRMGIISSYQKSDRRYLYSTTNLAAVIHKSKIFKLIELPYVVDARHPPFSVFAAAKEATRRDSLEHISYGTMMDYGKPSKLDRAVQKLIELLNESVTRPTRYYEKS